MMYPEAITISGVEYDINTGYQYALACFKCINDPNATDVERAYGVLGLLYKIQPGDKQEATRMAIKYLQLGKDPGDTEASERTPDMDFEQDMHFIRASFRTDYGIDLNRNPDMHWWEFSELLQGLKDNCILNRIRDLRNVDLTRIKDPDARRRIAQAQRAHALTDQLSDEDQQIIDDFYAQLK